MANKLSCLFTLVFKSDGASTQITFNPYTAPIGLASPGGAGYVFSPALATSPAPTSVEDLSIDKDGVTISFNSVTLGVIRLDLSDTITAGELHTVTGRIIF